MNRKKINDDWFFSNPWFLTRFFGVYVKGDALILLPFCFVLLLTGIFSIKFMLIGFGVYFSLRALGEMIYWQLQQFGPKTYRPWDFGLKEVSNNGIYVLYQLISLITVVFWIMFLFIILGKT